MTESALAQFFVREGRLRWRQHALYRMIQRRISRSEVRQTLLTGEVIEDYPHGKPFPSALMLAFVEERPLHVVVAFDAASERANVITAYEPGLDRFEPDFRTRRQR